MELVRWALDLPPEAPPYRDRLDLGLVPFSAPKLLLSCFISGLTMVYGRYNYR